MNSAISATEVYESKMSLYVRYTFSVCIYIFSYTIICNLLVNRGTLRGKGLCDTLTAASFPAHFACTNAH